MAYLIQAIDYINEVAGLSLDYGASCSMNGRSNQIEFFISQEQARKVTKRLNAQCAPVIDEKGARTVWNITANGTKQIAIHYYLKSAAIVLINSRVINAELEPEQVALQKWLEKIGIKTKKETVRVDGYYVDKAFAILKFRASELERLSKRVVQDGEYLSIGHMHMIHSVNDGVVSLYGGAESSHGNRKRNSRPMRKRATR